MTGDIQTYTNEILKRECQLKKSNMIYKTNIRIDTSINSFTYYNMYIA